MSTITTQTGHTSALPTPTVTPSTTSVDCIATVSVRGALLVTAAQNATAMCRRTQTGTAYRIDLGDGITCWLDGDQQDGSGGLNWVATQMCTTLSGGLFLGPHDAPFVCGPAVFTAAGPQLGPVALSDKQLRRIVGVHAEHIDVATPDDLNQLTSGPAVELHHALT